MTRGDALLVLTVVPDSGTEELSGLSGTMAISIVDKKHFYEFEYRLPDGGYASACRAATSAAMTSRPMPPSREVVPHSWIGGMS